MNVFTSTGKSFAAIPGVALLLCTALWSAPVEARVIRVTSCADAGAGSLRNAVAVARSGDLITLKQLACTNIVLTSGQIEVPQDSLILVGNDRLTVDGNRTSRVFRHTGTGTLRIEWLSVANGYDIGSVVYGGCIHSDGRLELHQASVHHCRLERRGGIEPQMNGAGVAAASVLVSHSKVFSNWGDSEGTGGGVYSEGPIRIYRSQIYGNSSYVGGAIYSGYDDVSVVYSHIHGNYAAYWGGAIHAWGNATINKSTISGNEAGWYCGAVCLKGASTVIVDSTLSGNSSPTASVANLYGDTTISNSTIVFNRETTAEGCSGAITTEGGFSDFVNLHIESSILSRNACAGGVGTDIGGGQYFTGALLVTVSGENNIVRRSRPPLPADTIRTDPQIGSLASNGGHTPTHALSGGSPAIDAGANPLDRLYDQRGPDYPRVVGARPDIGAFEYRGKSHPHGHGADH